MPWNMVNCGNRRMVAVRGRVYPAHFPLRESVSSGFPIWPTTGSMASQPIWAYYLETNPPFGKI